MTTSIIASRRDRAARPTRIRFVLSDAAAAFRSYLSHRRTENLLAGLEEHILKDIGLYPAAVRRAHPGIADWIISTRSGTAWFTFIGR